MSGNKSKDYTGITNGNQPGISGASSSFNVVKDTGSNWQQSKQRNRSRTSGGNVPPPDDAAPSFRNAVLSTVHSELRNINNRASNVVVTGLKPNQDKSDDDLFKDLCLTHLSIFIDPSSTSRIGKIKEDGSQSLLVSLRNATDASNMLGMAKLLRSSTDPEIRSKVFINKHLTAAEAKSAYEARVLRRSKALERTKQTASADVGSDSTESSTESSTVGELRSTSSDVSSKLGLHPN